ncbi:MAG: hypothetical protein U0670_19925 [Anaerolineae bacterium]
MHRLVDVFRASSTPLSIDSRLRWLVFSLLLGSCLIFASNKPDSLDGEAVLAVSAAIVRTGSPDMNAIAYSDWIMPPSAGMGRTGLDGATYAKKGISPTLALIPFVVAADVLPWLTTRATAMLFNPIVTALTGCILYDLIRRLRARPRTALVLSLLYGWATFALVYAKTLFGEPLTALLLTIAVKQVLDYADQFRARDAMWIGLCAGLLAGINTIYVLYAPLFAVALLVPHLIGGSADERHTYRIQQGVSSLIAFGVPVMVCGAVLGLFNLARFGSFVESGYRFSEGEGFIHPITTGLYGLFLSPYRGLFWYSPLLLLAIPGGIALLRSVRTRWVTIFLIVLIAAQALMFASWWSWHGGVVWGTRFLVPVVPLIVALITPLVEQAWSRRGLWLAIGAFAAVSIFVQLLGGLFDYLTYYSYLNRTFGNGDFYSPVTAMRVQVLYDPILSPVLGHLALLIGGWPLDPPALIGPDVVHLIAAGATMIAGILAIRVRSGRMARVLMIAVIFIALNVIGYRRSQTNDSERIQALNQAIPPNTNVLAETTAYEAGMLDLEGRRSVITVNAPTESTDSEANALIEYADRRGAPITLITWYAPADPANWIERRYWEADFFGGSTSFDGHRLLTFYPHDDPTPTPSGVRFGDVTLQSMGITRDRGLYVRLEWGADEVPADASQWFVHLIDAQGIILAQQDRQPIGGYAALSSQPVVDRLYFEDAAGSAALRIGWVDAAGNRLHAYTAEGERLGDDIVLIPISGVNNLP